MTKEQLKEQEALRIKHLAQERYGSGIESHLHNLRVMGVDMNNQINAIDLKTQIREKYKSLCLVLHPDKGGDEDAFKILKNSYDVLDYDALKALAKYSSKFKRAVPPSAVAGRTETDFATVVEEESTTRFNTTATPPSTAPQQPGFRRRSTSATSHSQHGSTANSFPSRRSGFFSMAHHYMEPERYEKWKGTMQEYAEEYERTLLMNIKARIAMAKEEQTQREKLLESEKLFFSNLLNSPQATQMKERERMERKLKEAEKMFKELLTQAEKLESDSRKRVEEDRESFLLHTALVVKLKDLLMVEGKHEKRERTAISNEEVSIRKGVEGEIKAKIKEILDPTKEDDEDIIAKLEAKLAKQMGNNPQPQESSAKHSDPTTRVMTPQPPKYPAAKHTDPTDKLNPTPPKQTSSQSANKVNPRHVDPNVR